MEVAAVIPWWRVVCVSACVSVIVSAVVGRWIL